MYGTPTKEGEAFTRQDHLAIAGSGAIADGSPEFVSGREFARVIRPCYRRVYWLVLLGTTNRVQQDGRATVSVLPRTEAACSINDQCSFGSCEAASCEAADAGLLSRELAAGMRRVKGAKRFGKRVGNWLTLDQARSLVRRDSESELALSLRAKRDRAIVALLLGCGLRRAELVGLHADDLQLREDHWIIADLVGKAKHVRTIPVPRWVKNAIDDWTRMANISNGYFSGR